MVNNPAFALLLIAVGAIVLVSGVLGTTGAMLSGLLYGVLPTATAPTTTATSTTTTQVSGTPNGTPSNVG